MLEHRNRNGWVRPHHDGPPLPLAEVVRLVMSANRVARAFQDVTSAEDNKVCLMFNVCMFVCMYVCMYVCVHVGKL
jgi:hypothetical protein